VVVSCCPCRLWCCRAHQTALLQAQYASLLLLVLLLEVAVLLLVVLPAAAQETGLRMGS
jgi:hypothetical protein